MLRLLTTALTLSLLTSVAVADRGHKNHDRRGPTVRDHRNTGPQHSRRPDNRGGRRVVARRNVRASNGRYVFAGGVTHTYARPVIRERYYNVRVRPAYVVESYTEVPGYVWVRGGWTWSGNEWRWGGGYYAVDQQYRNYYSDGSYDLRVNVRLGL